jgi:hypothetical protein
MQPAPMLEVLKQEVLELGPQQEVLELGPQQAL